MSVEEPSDWIALNLLPGFGPILTRRALERWGDPAEIAHRLSYDALATLGGLRATPEELREARRSLARRAADELARCRKLGVRLIVRGAPGYPAALAELPDAPILLYVRGELPPGRVRIALVGARRATSYGIGRARELGCELARHGVEVVSGGARGVDTAAHHAALEAGGRSVAVLGSGFEQPYPRENLPLFKRLAAQGAVLTEFALDCGPKPEHFPRRNRLISGLSAAVVVVEASTRSGSLITAAHALEQGREVMAVPGPVTSDRSEGCHRLIQQGAKLVQRVGDVLEELSPMYAAALTRPASPAGTDGEPLAPVAGATPDEAALLELLDVAEPVQLDDLADRAPFGIARLQLALLGLQLRGLIDALPGSHWRRRDR